MSDALSFRFESKLIASSEEVWSWIASIKGIRAEMWPFFYMTAPRGAKSLADLKPKPGVRMFRSYVFLFGFLPVDYSDMTLIEICEGRGFVEESPMGSMKLWRHERTIIPCEDEQGVVLLADQLTFQPRMASRFVGWFIAKVFAHRHRVVRRHFDGSHPK